MKVLHNPAETRKNLLNAAFQEIYRNGFQAASLDAILTNTNVTKGALYHYFPNKLSLGYAVVDEIIAGHMRKTWVESLDSSDSPLQTILEILKSAKDEMNACSYGCPLNNLAQEMSPVDEGFRIRVQKIFDEWRTAMTLSLTRGQTAGTVRRDISPERTAAFLQASFEGCISIAKNRHDKNFMITLLGGLEEYLESLKP